MSKTKTISIAFITCTMTLFIIIFPEQSLHASIHGLKTWWEIVFPSLLPFFIVAELLTSFGIVQFFGVLFEPMMRPLFNVPGVGSFAWILGMVSGFPSGAKITTILREKKEISQIEAERLISFSNASSPLFIFGAIAVGFFHQIQLGIIIAINHYVSNFLVGLIMRFHNHKREHFKSEQKFHAITMVKRAFTRMHQTRIRETRPFGEVLGDAVLSSIQTLLMIGGFIILFSVFTTLLSIMQITEIMYVTFYPLFQIMQMPSDFIHPLVTGLFEITMGAEAVAKTASLPIVWQLALISFILGFNGLSIQAQVASIIAKTDIRFYPYFIARLMHAIIASALTIFTYNVYFAHYLQIKEASSIKADSSIKTIAIVEKILSIGPMFTIISLAFACFILVYKMTKKST